VNVFGEAASNAAFGPKTECFSKFYLKFDEVVKPFHIQPSRTDQGWPERRGKKQGLSANFEVSVKADPLH